MIRIGVCTLFLAALSGCPPSENEGIGSESASSTAPASSTSDEHENSESSGPAETTEEPTTTTDVEPAPVCGNGLVEDGESCDDGENNGDAHDCTSACAHAMCGDGLVRSAPSNPDDVELCDDGEDNADGAYGGCQTDCTPGPFCGDGVVDVGYEECEPLIPNPDGPECMQDCYYIGRVVFVSSAILQAHRRKGKRSNLIAQAGPPRP